MTQIPRVILWLFLLGGIVLATGQYLFWREFDGPHRDGSVASIETKNAFQIKSTVSTVIGNNKLDGQLVRILLANRLDVPVTLLGASTFCSEVGCCTPIHFPYYIDGRSECWIEFELKWATTPESPISVEVFTNLSVDKHLVLRVLPDTTVIASDLPSAPADE